MTDASSPLILIIEDDAVARGSVSRALQDAGYQTIEAEDGSQGLASALAEHPSLIVCDNLMPNMNGTEVLEAIRADTWGKQVPFILLTSLFDMEAVNESLQAGNTDFLVKDDTGLDSVIEAVKRRLTA